MSQSSRHKALRPVREREQVARELAHVCKATGQGRHGCHQPAWDGVGRKPRKQALVESFDVHAAREYANGLVSLACPGCARIGCDGYFTAWCYPDRGRARLGRLILTALEGQPNGCQKRVCVEGRIPAGHMFGKPTREHDCPDCHGTGHNLRGVLPAVEWSAQVRRRFREISEAAYRSNGGPQGEAHRAFAAQRRELVRWAKFDESHAVRVLVDLELRPPATRVVPRGEHRHLGVRDPDHDLDRRISERRWCTWDDEHKPGLDARPRWERGDERHAAKRIARAAERRGAA